MYGVLRLNRCILSAHEKHFIFKCQKPHGGVCLGYTQDKTVNIAVIASHNLALRN